MLTVEAKFDGQMMMTDPVAHVENPNFTQELAWPVVSKALHQHKLQRSAVKVIVSSTDANAGPGSREEIGYVVLNLRTAQHEKVSVLNCLFSPLLKLQFSNRREICIFKAKRR